jgi:3-oxoacyl-[acyl-carrier protein] reductase
MTKVILITGGSDGLGKEIARQLSEKNKVVIMSPSVEKLKAAAAELSCDFVIGNVSDYQSCEQAVNNVIEKHGRIDCLVNNAGLWIQGELADNSPEDIAKVIAVNNTGVVFMTKAVIEQMKAQNQGLIININSQGGFYAKPERAVYSAAKWGVTGFTKSIQAELAPYGISVTGIYPGKMKTQMFEKMGITKDMQDGLDPKYVAQTVDFLLQLPQVVVIPEIGIKHLDN